VSITIVNFLGRRSIATETISGLNNAVSIYQLRLEFLMYFMVRNLLLFCAGMLLTLPKVCAQESPLLACPSSKTGQQTRNYAGYAVRLSRSSKRGERCQALVTLPVSKAGGSRSEVHQSDAIVPLIGNVEVTV